jgi:hypothetical protein
MSSGRSFSRCCRHRKPGQDNQQPQYAELSTAYCGCTAQVRLGEIFQSATVITERFPADFTAGAVQEFGSRYGQALCSKQMKLGK